MSRIKMFGAIPRAPHVTPQQFHDHYRHPHGTLGRQISVFRGYTQAHQVHCDLLDEKQTRFEACAEVWFDNWTDGAGLADEPIYLRDVKDDEPNFVDLPNLQWIFVEEDVICSGPNIREDISPGDKLWRLDNRADSFKITQFIEQDGATPWAQDNDFELGRRIGALRHVRGRPQRDIHPDGAFAIGVRELYWPTRTAMETGIAADLAAWHALIDRPAVATTFAATAERFI